MKISERIAVFNAIKGIPRIPELDFVNSELYFPIPAAEFLDSFIQFYDIFGITGTEFGDEGKGKEVDAFIRHALIGMALRLNSGENAGHTVVSNGEKFVFNVTPSGILVPEKICGIGPEVVLDPISYLEKEISQLKLHNVNYLERLFIGNVHIVAPHHKILDYIVKPSNSSTLKGMSPVHASMKWKTDLRLDHIHNSKDLQRKIINEDLILYNGILNEKEIDDRALMEKMLQLGEQTRTIIPEHIINFIAAKDKASFLIDLYEEKVKNNPDFPQRRDIAHMARKHLANGEKILVECAQSFWLSNNNQVHHCSATSANTTAAGTLSDGFFNFFGDKYRAAIINVAKPIANSRVGLGANPVGFVEQSYYSDKGIVRLDQLCDKCIDFDSIQKKFYDSIQENGIINPIEYTDASGTYSILEAMAISSMREFNETGATTKKPRVVGIFDLVALKQVMEVQGPYITLSAMDRGDKYDSVGLAVGYVYHDPAGESRDSNGKVYQNGEIIKIGDQYPCENVLRFCHPIIKKLKSWKDTPIASDKRNYDDPLPKEVCDFIGTIEGLTGAQVISIGNGPEGKDLIYVKKETY